MNISKKQLNKFNPTLLAKCYCWTCGSLTEDQLREIYSSKLIISEHSPEVYNLFIEHVRRY